ncbi:YxlC family protein [Oceanobacillus sp. Castelsardo]|uniref:YxlC family protein n=1 Tax=Oceanobacillus sp. Castelsardo TaxID=1851204 RepID=UPI000837DE22|nr:YxlC family protein [Oceanobacillus sp. Castelsardo]
MKKEEQSQLEKLKLDWKQLDELAENHVLTRLEMKEQLKIYQEKRKKAFLKELILFFVTAVFIISFIIISLVQAPILFLVIEISAIVIGPIVYFVLINRKKKEREAHL